MRPGTGAFAAGSTGAVATSGCSTTTTGVVSGADASTWTSATAGTVSTSAAAGVSIAGGTSASSGTSASISTAGAAAGFAILTSRGGGNDGPAGLTGSAAFFPGAAPFLPLATGVSAKMSPPGSEMLRSRASRSTNWRATTSSIVLEALLASMPRRLRSDATSWLDVPSSSATL